MEEKSAAVSAEIPESLRRAIKSHAALRGETLNDFITRALQETLRSEKENVRVGSVVVSEHRKARKSEQSRLTA